MVGLGASCVPFAELKVNLKAGTYELYCPVDGHAEEGMEGKLMVKGGSGATDRPQSPYLTF